MYSGSTARGGRRTFGTSGLLYRSNKLMYDRQTYTLWSNLTGEPVVGRLAPSPVRLEILPATVTTWEEWRSDSFPRPGSTEPRSSRFLQGQARPSCPSAPPV